MSDRLFQPRNVAFKIEGSLGLRNGTLPEPRVSVSLWRAISCVVSTSRTLTSTRRNLQTSRSICNRHDGCIVAAMAIHQITKVGGVSTPMASTCFCAWFRASGHRHRKPSRLSRFCRARCAESTPNGWPASAASLRERCLIAVAEAGRLLDWLGERATREELATLTHRRCGRLHEVSGSGR